MSEAVQMTEAQRLMKEISPLVSELKESLAVVIIVDNTGAIRAADARGRLNTANGSIALMEMTHIQNELMKAIRSQNEGELE